MRRWLVLFVCAWLLSACGGGGSSSGSSTSVQPQAAEPVLLNASGPGEYRKAAALAKLTADQFSQALKTATRAPVMQPRYAVQGWRIEYQTTDADGLAVTASALLALPDKPSSCLEPLAALPARHAVPRCRRAQQPRHRGRARHADGLAGLRRCWRWTMWAMARPRVWPIPTCWPTRWRPRSWTRWPPRASGCRARVASSMASSS